MCRYHLQQAPAQNLGQKEDHFPKGGEPWHEHPRSQNKLGEIGQNSRNLKRQSRKDGMPEEVPLRAGRQGHTRGGMKCEIAPKIKSNG
ncbi:hypothetical protein EMPG_16317 [Blastomyces silverae]|uniref:Uncharacterized protein n=1 Tax=Blastomyces silverae TaxID=2060906 RepID=A0A0H1B9W2_9EURO|nr:hypothetical protein EMPG_16317 [Blastomyces silverae]